MTIRPNLCTICAKVIKNLFIYLSRFDAKLPRKNPAEVRDVLEPGLIGCLSNSDFRTGEQVLCLMKTKRAEIIIRRPVCQRPELAIKLGTAHGHLMAKFLDIVILIAQV